MEQCCVIGCSNSSVVKNDISNAISFHPFPSNPALRKKWLTAIDMSNWSPPGHARVCSAHFHSDQFEVQLHKDAVPVIRLRCNNEETEDSKTRACRICLATDVKLHSLDNPILRTSYNGIMRFGTLDLTIEGMPWFLCWECAGLAARSWRLAERARRAHDALVQIHDTYGRITTDLVKTANRSTLKLKSSLEIDINPTKIIDSVHGDEKPQTLLVIEKSDDSKEHLLENKVKEGEDYIPDVNYKTKLEETVLPKEDIDKIDENTIVFEEHLENFDVSFDGNEFVNETTINEVPAWEVNLEEVEIEEAKNEIKSKGDENQSPFVWKCAMCEQKCATTNELMHHVKNAHWQRAFRCGLGGDGGHVGNSRGGKGSGGGGLGSSGGDVGSSGGDVGSSGGEVLTSGSGVKNSGVDVGRSGRDRIGVGSSGGVGDGAGRNGDGMGNSWCDVGNSGNDIGSTEDDVDISASDVWSGESDVEISASDIGNSGSDVGSSEYTEMLSSGGDVMEMTVDRKKPWFGVQTTPPKERGSYNSINCGVCKSCGQSFKTKTQLRRHELRHKPPTVPCTLCSKVFHDNKQLRLHMISHGDLRPYSCHTCDRAFTDKWNLIKHFRTHSKLAAYECSVCEKKFKDSFTRKIHVQIVHNIPYIRQKYSNSSVKNKLASEIGIKSKSAPAPEPRPSAQRAAAGGAGDTTEAYKCDYCPEALPSRKERWAHVLSTHPANLRGSYSRTVNVVCEICGRGYATTGRLRLHELRHGPPTVPCTLCPKRFFDKYRLRDHMETHRNLRRHCCDTCGRGFNNKTNLIRHYRMHSDEMRYACHLCTKKFKHSDSRNMHVRTVHFKQPWPPRKKRSKNVSDKK